MQCRSKNITCAFLVTAHIVHKAVVVSLRKIFWWNGFIIFITGKSSTKLHVTLFWDLSLQAFHLNLAQWIKVTLTQGLAFTNGVKFYTFLVLFFPCKIPMPIYFYGISIFSLLSAITILMSFAWRICIASTTIPQLIFLFILVTCLLDIVFILYSKILF